MQKTTKASIMKHLESKVVTINPSYNVKSEVIHFAFDKTVSPSIKDCERDKRMLDRRDSLYHISGPGQKHLGSCVQGLRNDQFKNL